MIRFEAAAWPASPTVRALQTWRYGGVSQAPYDSLNLASHVEDDPEAVVENRRRLRVDLQLPQEPRWLNQVHGIQVVKLQGQARPDAALPEADAAWTDEPGIVCAVLTADCLPVLFCASDGSVVAAAHAGWRGLLAGVLDATVAALPRPAEDLQAWLGAAIGPAQFEVGPEVRDAFADDSAPSSSCFRAGRGDRWYADLYALARQRLHRLGVRNVYGGGHCTVDEADRYFSFRRSARCGRMASLIWRNGS